MSRENALKEKLPELLDYFSSKEVILTVLLFGSFGTEACTELSDMDIALILNRKVSLMEEMKISADLSLILGRDDVDVVILNETMVDLRHEILCNGDIIFEKDRLITADFVENTLNHYFDYGLTLKKMKDDFWEQLREEV
ncbi:MAG: nucleotidyltransferase domain-containing protein [Bacillota bacterium]|nr:nucleotidyltransferase domain-containing protein [Bacillota bacterium]